MAEKSKAQAGVEKAMEKAQAGELVDRLGRKMTPQQLANLRPARTWAEKDPEAAAAVHRAGAAATNAIKRQRRTIKDICDVLLAMDLPDLQALKDADAREAASELERQTGRKVSVYEAIVCAQAMAAMQGSTKAAEYIRDSAGDKPGDSVHIDADTMTDGDRALLAKLAAKMGIDEPDEP